MPVVPGEWRPTTPSDGTISLNAPVLPGEEAWVAVEDAVDEAQGELLKYARLAEQVRQ